MQQLILIKDVEKLGRRGLVVRVRDGFARNFLLPRDCAVLATPENLKRLESLRKKYEVEEQERKSNAAVLAERLEGHSITIAMKVSDEGHLYGSVNVAMLVELLGKDGLEVEPRSLRLLEPIKEIGVYTVPVVLHDEARAEIKVYVVKEAEESEEPAAG